jgi:glutamine synthetase
MAARSVLPKFFERHLPVVFNGNNYDPEWEIEAGKRGLWNLKDTVSALSRYSDQEVKDVFLRHGVLSDRELMARQDVLLENYIKVCQVEVKLVRSLGRSSILPVALDSLKKAADLVNSTKNAEGAGSLPENSPQMKQYKTILALATSLSDDLDALDKKSEEVEAIEGVLPKAEAVRDILLPLTLKVRSSVDALELVVDDNRWPLPKYGELLWQ